MTLKRRIALFLGLLVAGFGAALGFLRYLESAERAELVATDRETRRQMLNRWLDITTRALPQFAGDAAQSTEFADLLAAPDSANSREKISQALASAGIHAVWVVRGDGTTRLRYQAPDSAAPTDSPVAAAEFSRIVAETPSPRFFVEQNTALWEVCLRRLPDRAGEWLVAGRIWDAAQLEALAQLTECRVTLAPTHALAEAPAAADTLVLVRPLVDARGNALRVLRLEYTTKEISRTLAWDARQTFIFIAFGLLLIAATTLALRAWVLHPLRRIGDSLVTDQSAPLAELSREQSEFGQVASRLLASFEQRAALQRSEAALRQNLEERARLGRDLHDGVIQSLYAAGMGLAGIRALLKPEQTEAATRLEQTRAVLNETIHDVRNFIVGLEPEALKLQTFSQAVAALVDVMHGMRPFKSTLEIDEELAGRLTLAQRVHALQIAREAVSNALRHGEAGHVRIRLRRNGEFAEFEVGDDGRGFDARATLNEGRGLGNFAQRARELGAELSVVSQPGQGTQVRLVFSLHP